MLEEVLEVAVAVMAESELGVWVGAGIWTRAAAGGVRPTKRDDQPCLIDLHAISLNALHCAWTCTCRAAAGGVRPT